MRAITCLLEGFIFDDGLVDDVVGIADKTQRELQVREHHDDPSPALMIGDRLDLVEFGHNPQHLERIRRVQGAHARRLGNLRKQGIVDRFLYLSDVFRHRRVGVHPRPAIVVGVRPPIANVQVGTRCVEQKVIALGDDQRHAFAGRTVLRANERMNRRRGRGRNARVRAGFIVGIEHVDILGARNSHSDDLLDPPAAQFQHPLLRMGFLPTQRHGTDLLRKRIYPPGHLEQQGIPTPGWAAQVVTGWIVPTVGVANMGGTAPVRKCPVGRHRFSSPPPAVAPSPVSRSSCPRIAASSTMSSAARRPASAASAGGGRSDA